MPDDAYELRTALSRAAMREADRRTIEEIGIPGRVLMECAGREVAFEVLRELAAMPVLTTPVAVVCGPGNNGGDGFVVSRTLLNRGIEVRTFFVGDGHPAGESDAVANRHVLARLHHMIESVQVASQLRELRATLPGCSLVVDALFGTGLARDLEGIFADVAGSLNDCGVPCVAVDIPSGLDADSGNVLGVAVKARTTVTFGAKKRGMLLGAGPSRCGTVRVVEMGIPESVLDTIRKAAEYRGLSEPS